MAFTYDVSSPGGQVRLLIFDTNSDSYVYEDAEIAAFLTLEHGSVRRAAALALEGIASNEAFTLKVVQLLDLKTDGAQTATALMSRAKELRAQALLDDAAESGGFDIAEWVNDSFTFRQRIINQALRRYP